MLSSSVRRSNGGLHTLTNLGESRAARQPALPGRGILALPLTARRTPAPWLTRHCHGKAARSVRQKTQAPPEEENNEKSDGLGWLAAGAMLLAASEPSAQTEIQWWHAMTGANNDVIVKLANDFNATQKDYKVVPTYKGSYPDTMNAGIAAFRAGNAPHIMQVFEVGTATMMAATGAVKPVHVLMKEAGETFDPKAYLSAITGYYSTTKGEMLSFPFNSSSTVMWYNKDALQEGRPRPRQAAEDLARGVRGGQEAEGRRPSQLRLRQRLGHLGQPRAALGLAQRAALHQGQRHGRLRHGAQVQRAAARQASAEPGRAAEGQDLRLFGPHQHRRRPLHLGRVPDLPDLVGLLRQRQGERQVRLRQRADALLSGRRTARRRTRSSAAPRCG